MAEELHSGKSHITVSELSYPELIDDKLLRISLAIACAQKEMGLFSKIPSRIADQICNNTFKDFHFEEAGVMFTCDTEYSGYETPQSDYLMPQKNAVGTYFSLSFSINKPK